MAGYGSNFKSFSGCRIAVDEQVSVSNDAVSKMAGSFVEQDQINFSFGNNPLQIRFKCWKNTCFL